MPQQKLIPDFQGDIFERDHVDYKEKSYQYAYSTHSEDHNMSPFAILYPVDINDIQKAVRYAKNRNPKIAIAVRTGGHQYSGASSTFGDNILIDLSNTFRGADDFKKMTDDETGRPRVRTGISWSLGEFNKKMSQLTYFIPHGQCSHVHLGGHVQTGGYGQLGRSFGLFGDHVLAFDIVTADGELQTVSQATNPDLFYAVLGGSPGNFGIVTHLTLYCHRDKDHDESRGFRQAYIYHKDTLRKLLDIVVEIADAEEFARDFDYCVTVLSGSEDVINFLPGVDEEMRHSHKEDYGEQNDLPGWPPMILVYAQWANTGGKAQKYDSTVEAWFNKIKKAGGFFKYPFTGFDNTHKKPMSELTGQWVFTNVREFDDPYEKRTYLTNSKTLVADKWTEWVSKRIDKIQMDITSHCNLSIQI
jgi:hypothetical protein